MMCFSVVGFEGYEREMELQTCTINTRETTIEELCGVKAAKKIYEEILHAMHNSLVGAY
jgi:hypothetical protein